MYVPFRICVSRPVLSLLSFGDWTGLDWRPRGVLHCGGGWTEFVWYHKYHAQSIVAQDTGKTARGVRSREKVRW